MIRESLNQAIWFPDEEVCTQFSLSWIEEQKQAKTKYAPKDATEHPFKLHEVEQQYELIEIPRKFIDSPTKDREYYQTIRTLGKNRGN